jgi:hypothetical protein
LKTTKLTEAECQNVTWEVVGIEDGYRYSVGRGTHPVTGMPIEVMRTETLIDEPLQAINKAEREIRDGKRWGSGAGSEKGGNMPMIHVASVPMNKYLADFAEKKRGGDKEHQKWLLNSEAYQPFRTKSGKL